MLLGITLIILGALFFVSSVTLASCAGSLIVASGCEGWLGGVVLTFWLVGALFFTAAVPILVFGLKSSVNETRKDHA